MNMEHVRFVVAWTLAPSLKVVSAVLGIAPECVIRQAKQMRAAGVPLKDLGDVRDGHAGQTNDTQVLPPTEARANRAEKTVSSYTSQLKTDAQMCFYGTYTVGRNGAPSIAESVANHHALKSGDIGRAGIASGVVEDAAFEAVAQLAVAPPKGFNLNHRRAEGFVIRHIQNAVRNRLKREYGWQGKRFCRRITTNVQQSVAAISPADADGGIAKAKALEVVRGRQLEQVRAALPGGVIPTDRPGRITVLRCFGEGKTQAITNAAEHRFYDAAAKHIRGLLQAHSTAECRTEEPVQPPNKHPAKASTELTVNRIPPRLRERLAPVPLAKSRKQREAERFVIAWERSSTAQEAARKLNRSVKSTTTFATRLRQLGVTNLKELPTCPGPLVRGARALVPSMN